MEWILRDVNNGSVCMTFFYGGTILVITSTYELEDVSRMLIRLMISLILPYLGVIDRSGASRHCIVQMDGGGDDGLGPIRGVREVSGRGDFARFHFE